MKKTIVMFVVAALVLAGTAVWAFKGHLRGSVQEIIMAGIALVLVAFALYAGLMRLRSHRLKEPAEDEMSKNVMRRASSLAFYVSIYLWLFVGFVSDKTDLEPHSLIGTGIVGMAVVFLLCWIGVRMFGMKND